MNAPRIEILNARLGFATNSSSTHSIIYMPDPDGITDSQIGNGFGWQHFTVISRERKMEYLASCLADSVSSLPSPVAAEIVRNLIGKEWIGIDPTDLPYVDHQSRITIPSEWDSRIPMKEYVDDLKDFLSDPHIAILGGNDNDDEGHPLSGFGDEVLTGIPKEKDHYDLVARKDQSGWWTVFSRRNGSKTRFVFSRDGRLPSDARSSAPELVDISITDYCDFGCKYCYRGSTRNGTHASMDVIRRIAQDCHDRRVFEVAIGGGEPMSHPCFVEILQSFREAGVVPNFTTRRSDWLSDEYLSDKIFSLIGGVAFSVDSADDIDRLVRPAVELRRDAADPPSQTIHIQYVVGSGPPDALRAVLAAAEKLYVGVTLLGWKTTGRGKRSLLRCSAKEAWDVFADMRKNRKLGMVAIDTTLAAEWERYLVAAKIDSRLFHVEEGKHSMFVDAVHSRCGASSYANLNGMVDYGGPDGGGLQEAWNKLVPHRGDS